MLFYLWNLIQSSDNLAFITALTLTTAIPVVLFCGGAEKAYDLYTATIYFWVVTYLLVDIEVRSRPTFKVDPQLNLHPPTETPTWLATLSLVATILMACAVGFYCTRGGRFFTRIAIVASWSTLTIVSGIITADIWTSQSTVDTAAYVLANRLYGTLWALLTLSVILTAVACIVALVVDTPWRQRKLRHSTGTRATNTSAASTSDNPEGTASA